MLSHVRSMYRHVGALQPLPFSLCSSPEANMDSKMSQQTYFMILLSYQLPEAYVQYGLWMHARSCYIFDARLGGEDSRYKLPVGIYFHFTESI